MGDLTEEDLVMHDMAKKVMDANTPRDEVEFILSWAAKWGHLSIIQRFFNKHEHLSFRWLLLIACDYGHLPIVKYLIDKWGTPHDGHSLVRAALVHQHMDVAQYLRVHYWWKERRFRISMSKLIVKGRARYTPRNEEGWNFGELFSYQYWRDPTITKEPHFQKRITNLCHLLVALEEVGIPTAVARTYFFGRRQG